MSLLAIDNYNEEDVDLLRLRLNCLATEQDEGWQEKSIALIRRARFEDSDCELRRLRALGVINPEIEGKQEKAISGVWSVTSDTMRLKVKVMMGRCLEIQNIYKRTHDVFIHAQSSKWLVCPDLIKELMKVHHPSQDFHQFKFLRMPGLSRNWDISHYSQDENVRDNEAIPREDLISADGYFYNSKGYESALHFMCQNSNISSSSLIVSVVKNAIQSFYPSLNSESFDLDGYATRVAAQTEEDCSSIGNLFVLCIPKEKSSSIQYRAHPFGEPCKCHEGEEGASILNLLQEGVLNEETKCSYYTIPQFRIFTPELKKENGVKIYLIPSEKTYRKALKERVRNIVQEIHGLYLLEKTYFGMFKKKIRKIVGI